MKHVAITGIGIVSPYGLTGDKWFKSLCSGRQLLSPVRSFKPPLEKSRSAIEIADFDYKKVLNAKGLHFFGRTHLLAATASQIALTDTGLEKEDLDPARLGLILAMAFGTIQSITHFYDQAVSNGPAGVSPMDFANTVANSPASRTAILLGARGINATLANGETAGIEALTISAKHLALGHEQIILAGSAYALCLDMYRAFGALGRLSPIENNGHEQLLPLDTRANGVVLGETSVILALEPPEPARDRGGNIYGHITGSWQGFIPDRDLLSDHAEHIFARTMAQAIKNAGLSFDQITWIAASSNGHPILDTLEARALFRVFGSSSPVRVVALKSMSGECFDVAGPQGVAAAVLSMKHAAVPPTANLKTPRPELPEKYFTYESETMRVRHVLVNTLSFNGGCSSLVVSEAKK